MARSRSKLEAGEIVGLAGLRGAGQNAIGRAIAGIDESTGGQVTLQGQPLRAHGRVADAMAAGVSFVTSNRESEGLALPLTVTENLFLNPGALGRRLCGRPSGRGRERLTRRRGRSEILGSHRRPYARHHHAQRGQSAEGAAGALARPGGSAAVLEEPTMGVDVGCQGRDLRDVEPGARRRRRGRSWSPRISTRSRASAIGR